MQNSSYNGAYAQGTFVGMALPAGYKSAEGITITAQTLTQTGTSFQIQFNLASAFNTRGKGVYAIYIFKQPINISSQPIRFIITEKIKLHYTFSI